jgi:hypothetical protein
MKHYRAPWSTSLVVLTALATMLLLGSATALLWHGKQSALGALLAAVWAGSLLFVIRGYTIAPDAIEVHRLLWRTRLLLRDLESVRCDPGAMRGSLRLFGNGGLFSFTGLYRNPTLGTYRAFVTDPSRSVILRFPARTVVLSPAEPETFAQELRSTTSAAPL